VKIRAYKLAEELGLDRNDLVEKAKSFGIELKNAMASLEDDQAELLRERLGKSGGADSQVVERRVESKGGTTVLRRRKRVREVEEPQAEEVEATEEAEAEPVVEVLERAPEPLVDEALPISVEPSPEGIGVEGEPSVAPASDVEIAAEPSPREPLDERAGAPKGDGGAAQADRRGKQRKRVREVVNLQEQEQFARQITGRVGTPRRASPLAPLPMVNPRRKRRDRLAAPAAVKPASEQKRVIKISGDTSVGELAKLLGAKAPVVQGKLMALGIMVSINQTVDIETCRQVAKDFGFEVQDVGFKEEEFLEPAASSEGEVAISAGTHTRPPVVTVMGHVDHGKTSLLDAIRKTRIKVVDGEAGGITQHIGAYQVESGGQALTFIDTPGHAAFTAMRARGAAVTDIVVLVVAADDGVMPQTVEAIEHARAAGCPIVVAINKVDLPDADPDRTRQRLTEHNLVPEEFGGDIICVNVSAKTGQGLDQLLEMLALQSEVLELKADPTRNARGVVLEARLDKGRGPVATVLIQDGTLHQGDAIVVETVSGRVRVMENDLGERLGEAGPSVPVQVIGLSDVPTAGAVFNAVDNERVAKQIASHREDRERGRSVVAKPKLTLEDFFARSEGDGPKELGVVLKADVQGTCEAVRDSLERLSTDEVKLKVLSSGVGGITENDVMLASASGAIVLGFHVRPDPAARRAADDHGVDIRTYTVIMDLLDEVKAAMAGLLPPTFKEIMLGRAEVKETFSIPRIGTIAGSLVVEGRIARGSRCRLVRDGVQVYEGTLGSLRRFKDDAREVQSGLECGIGIEGYNDVKIGDVIEVFDLEQLPATL